MKKKAFDLLTLGEILLRLSPPDNERIVRGETFQKQVGGAELNVASGVSLLGLRSGIISRIPDSSSVCSQRIRSGSVESVMIIWYTIQEKMQDWACITTRTEHTRENRAWSMTDSIRP